MESRHFILTRPGTMNLRSGRVRRSARAVLISYRTGVHGVTRPTCRFMESRLALLRMHLDHDTSRRDELASP